MIGLILAILAGAYFLTKPSGDVKTGSAFLDAGNKPIYLQGSSVASMLGDPGVMAGIVAMAQPAQSFETANDAANAVGLWPNPFVHRGYPGTPDSSGFKWAPFGYQTMSPSNGWPDEQEGPTLRSLDQIADGAPIIQAGETGLFSFPRAWLPGRPNSGKAWLRWSTPAPFTIEGGPENLVNFARYVAERWPGNGDDLWEDAATAIPDFAGPREDREAPSFFSKVKKGLGYVGKYGGTAVGLATSIATGGTVSVQIDENGNVKVKPGG